MSSTALLAAQQGGPSITDFKELTIAGEILWKIQVEGKVAEICSSNHNNILESTHASRDRLV